MLKDAKVLNLSLLDTVDSLIKEAYGKEYRAAKSGVIYYDGEGVPFETGVGSWHIHNDSLYVQVSKK